MANNISIDADFVINEQPDIQADLHINYIPDVSNFVTREELAEDLADKQDVLTAGDNIQIEDNVISATDTTYTAGEGISIVDNVISNTQTSAEWGNIQGDIADQTDLNNLINSKVGEVAGDLTIEETARINADTRLQENIDTLSGTVSNNYNTLDGKIGDNTTAINNHKADKSNPHEVTKSQVGLGNVDNTSDINKPISTATQTALDGKVPTSRTVNGKALTSDITLNASDVDALPDTTTINDLTTAEQQSALNSGANSTNIGQIATNTQNISNEVTNRQNADNALQSQIDALVVASDVFDIVGTYAELQAYDISTVPVNDIIKVLVDSTHDNAATYYRCVENDNVKSWSYIGAEGAYYTKSEADNRFVEQTTTVNGQALSNNITLDAEDVGALPDSTTIGNGTLTIQKNGSTIDSFGANDTGNTTVNITVPTDTGDLTNNAGYTKNVGTVTSVNNTQPDANGNVTLSIPAAQVNSDWAETDTSSKAYIENKPTLSTVATTGDYNDLSNKPTIPTVNNATLTITQGGTTKGTFTANAGTDVTIDLDAGGGSSTDVQINGTSITSGGVADIITEGVYDASSNKIATMSELADKQDVLTAGDAIQIASNTVDNRSTATVQTVGSNRWQEVAYINNKFIAIGNDGYIATSSDGETWETPYRVGTKTWRGIAYGNNTYVIGGNDGVIAYSSDGENWTTTTVGSNQINDIQFFNNQFILGDQSGNIRTSSDGVTWSNAIAVGVAPISQIAYGNGLYLTAGNNGEIATSTDGENWTITTVGNTLWTSCVFANNMFVIGGRGKYTTSTDGINWTTPQSIYNMGDFQEIVYSGNCFVATGQYGSTTTSTDGINWTTPVVWIGSSDWYGLAYGNDKFVAVGDSGKMTYFEVYSATGQKISVVADNNLSSTSENPVQNKVVYTALNSKVPTSRTVNGKALTSNIILTTSDISNCESTTNKVTAINSGSTDSEYPTAKCMYDIIGDVETLINAL